jgi:hypothetical protein
VALRHTDDYGKVVGRNKFCPLFARQNARLHEDPTEFTKLIKTRHCTKGAYKKKTHRFEIRNFYWSVLRNGARSVMQ